MGGGSEFTPMRTLQRERGFLGSVDFMLSKLGVLTSTLQLTLKDPVSPRLDCQGGQAHDPHLGYTGRRWRIRR